MLLHKYWLITLILAVSLNAQSVINGYGIGETLVSGSGVSAISSTSGLTPGFQPGVAINNPATWINLRYTYFTSTYGGNTHRLKSTNTINQRSGIGQIRLIIPIKGKYALGLSYYPLTDNRGEYFSDTPPWINGADTVQVSQFIANYGGINSAGISFGYSLNDHWNFGFFLNYLYGSSRHKSVLNLNSIDYVQYKRFLYSGSTAKLFIVRKDLKLNQYIFDLYSAFSYSLSPVDMLYKEYYPFEDSSQIGSIYHIYDEKDFPYPYLPSNPEEIRISSVYRPSETTLGIAWNRSQNFSLNGSVNYWADSGRRDKRFNVFNNRVTNKSTFDISMIKFSVDNSEGIFNQFQYRLGIYHKSYGFAVDRETVNENGISFGIGYKFGITNNQIDFGYILGSRTGNNWETENMQKYLISITLGDIWFVKRRAM